MNKRNILLTAGVLLVVSLSYFLTFRDKPFGSFVGPSKTTNSLVTYDFAAINIPTERPGAASSSTGFEFGRIRVDNVAAFSVASSSFTMSSTSNGFAVTMGEAGKVRACAFTLNGNPTTGTVGLQIQKNGTLQSTVYCKLPSSSTFAANGGNDDVSTSQAISTSDITFVAGDRLGVIATSSNLNAATFDGDVQLLVEITQ